MFRLNAVESFNLVVPSDVDKRCRVRFPKDDEWEERVKKVKVLRTAIGRDKFQSDAPGEKAADAELFNKIRLDKDGVPFDDSEASAAVGIIDRCRVLKVEKEADRYRVTLEVPRAEVTALLRSPSRKQADEYEKRSMTWVSGRRVQEFRSSLLPAAQLFDAVMEEVTGYAAAVPIIHKFAFIGELLAQCDEAVVDGIELPEE